MNTYTYGDQFAPRLSASGTGYLAVWTSLAQDGSQEGIFGQVSPERCLPFRERTQVNTTWINKQMHPAVASDGQSKFLVAWTGFIGGPQSFDLFAQRYVNVGQPLQAMTAPFVNVPFVLSNGVYQPQIEVSWPLQSGLAIDHYEVYVDGAPSPAVSLGTNVWTLSGVAPKQHTFIPGCLCDLRRQPVTALTSHQRHHLGRL